MMDLVHVFDVQVNAQLVGGDVSDVAVGLHREGLVDVQRPDVADQTIPGKGSYS
jgi:hypothetical protein